MSQETATVEVLTAEVRVLMVGSRQVTLSVARQLDAVPRDEFTPFGRVSMNYGPMLIGRDRDGNLVLSEAYRADDQPRVNASDLEGDRVLVCSRFYVSVPYNGMFGQSVKTWINLSWWGQPFSLDRDVVDWCLIQHSEGEACDPPWTGPLQTIAGVLDGWQRRKARADDDAALPLIVLAGLR